MSAPSPPAQVVPAAYSYTSTASTPLSSPGLIEVPWFAKLGSSNSNECYYEEEMYPQQQPLNLIIRKPRRKVSREERKRVSYENLKGRGEYKRMERGNLIIDIE